MIVTLSLLLPAMMPVSANAADAPTIAIIDYEKILADSKAGASLQKQIQAKRESFSKEFAEKDKTLKAAQADIVESKEKLSAEEFNKKRKAFDAQVADVKSLFEKRSNSLRQGVDKSMTELRKKILEASAKVAETKGFDLVLTRDAVVIAEKDMDITADVLKELDVSTPSVTLKVE
jgi:outer membrane protein